jgi:hypothetical protein
MMFETEILGGIVSLRAKCTSKCRFSIEGVGQSGEYRAARVVRIVSCSGKHTSLAQWPKVCSWAVSLVHRPCSLNDSG